MKRFLVRKIWDDKEQVLAYTQADFSDSNQEFCDLLLLDYGTKIKHILDLGCGPADIPIRLVRRKPKIKVTAVDASTSMISLAKAAIRSAGFEKQIIPVVGKIPGLQFEADSFDTIISKDLLHHLPDPMMLWNEIIKLAKETGKELVAYIMDLCRPGTPAEARKIVNDVSGNAPDILRDDFFKSLLASFTISEVKKQLSESNLNLQVSKVSERHLLVKGIIDMHL